MFPSLTKPAWLLLCFPLLLPAADFSKYRGFILGEPIADAARKAGRSLSDVRTVPQRPASIQEVDWRPVEEGLLRFYNGKLFQLVITYDRQKIEGMSEADLIEAISQTYGRAVTVFKPSEAEIPLHSNYSELAPVIARWDAPPLNCSLIQTGSKASYALVLTHVPMDVLARVAIVEAQRLDAVEAPRRALELRARQEANDENLRNKARAINIPAFRP
jgi:hypothetical protein